MTRRVASIASVAGRDGAFLSELHPGKGREVHGIERRSSSFNTGPIERLYHGPHVRGLPCHLHYGDVTDATNLHPDRAADEADRDPRSRGGEPRECELRDRRVTANADD